MTDADQIYEAALQLPLEERMLLIARLLDSYYGDSNSHAREAWGTEISQRLAELDGGEVTTISWPESREMIVGNFDGPNFN